MSGGHRDHRPVATARWSRGGGRGGTVHWAYYTTSRERHSALGLVA